MSTEIIGYLKRSNGSIVEHVGWHESGDYMLRSLFASDEGSRTHKFDTERDYVPVTVAEIDKIERTTCLSRTRQNGPWEHKENIDYWLTLPNGDRVCNFCGSLHPDDVVRIMGELGPECISKAKSDKWYVKQPGIQNASQGGIKYYRWHETPDFLIKIANLQVQSTDSVN